MALMVPCDALPSWHHKALKTRNAQHLLRAELLDQHIQLRHLVSSQIG